MNLFTELRSLVIAELEAMTAAGALPVGLDMSAVHREPAPTLLPAWASLARNGRSPFYLSRLGNRKGVKFGADHDGRAKL